MPFPSQIYEKLLAIAWLEPLWGDIDKLATALYEQGYYTQDKKGLDRTITLLGQVEFLKKLKTHFQKDLLSSSNGKS